jgi:hypothetical protein
MKQEPNVILLHNNQNESRFLDHFPNLSTITNYGNFHWNYDGKEVLQQSMLELQYLNYLPEIIWKLKYLSPIFSRHYDDQPFMELNYRKIGLTVINLASFIKQKNVKIIVFPFGSNHWLEGFILELAGELVGTKFVFLYPTVVDSRLLPMVQTEGIESRRIIAQEYSNFSLDSDVLMKVENTVANSHPKTFTTRFIPFEKISMLLIFLYYVKNFFNMKKIPSKNQSVEISNFKLGTELRVFKEQNKAIKEYLKIREIDQKSFSSSQRAKITADKLPIVIFSHYQPEATSFPDGGKWANIIDIVSLIRSTGYSEVIYYREHPALIASTNSINKYPNRIGTARSKEFYSQLKLLNCAFIKDLNFAEDEFIALTITGTIALERSLRGSKTIVAGNPWFLGMPGQIALEDFLCQGSVRDNFLRMSDFGPAAFNFLKLHFDNKSMSNILNQDMFNLSFSSEEIISFKEDLNKLFYVLSSTQDLETL